MISEQQLAEWERLASEATGGPWVFHEGRIRHKALKQEKSFAAHLSIPNGNFIAAAREAVPELIAEVRTMKKMLRWFANYCSDLEGHNPDDWIDGVEHEVTKND